MLPLFIIYKNSVNILIKYKSDFSTGTMYEMSLDFFTSLMGAFLIFAVHTQVPSLFMTYFYNSNAGSISSKVGNNGRDYTYQGITGDYIKKSIQKIQGSGRQ